MPTLIDWDQIRMPIITASTITRVATANTNHQLVAANPNRKALFFYNDSSNQQWIKFGIIASQTDFTVRLTSQTYYEVPFPLWLGQMDVIGNGSNGAIQVTELT